MAKLNTKMGISMKTLTDKSTRNLAEMLTQGSGMGHCVFHGIRFKVNKDWLSGIDSLLFLYTS